MSDWTAKRFWTDVAVTETERGFGIALDGRPVKTPAKAPLVVPTRALAEQIAAEWGAVEKTVNPEVMPFTRSANAAIDKVATQHAEVVHLLAEYGGSDLLCYRATTPAELVAIQVQGWDPVLQWATDDLGAPLTTGQGIAPIAQPQASLDRLAEIVMQQDVFSLTGFHDLVSMSGSLILALAVQAGRLDPAQAWDLSRIDEDWQISQWGADDEASATAERKRTAFLHAHSFCRLALPAG
ncbi:MAG: chaperone required for assembly of F1-ATPase [Paracoccaceae bacterium]|jgi:chaperone required for assembly of F1-ATPase